MRWRDRRELFGGCLADDRLHGGGFDRTRWCPVGCCGGGFGRGRRRPHRPCARGDRRRLRRGLGPWWRGGGCAPGCGRRGAPRGWGLRCAPGCGRGLRCAPGCRWRGAPRGWVAARHGRCAAAGRTGPGRRPVGPGVSHGLSRCGRVDPGYVRHETHLTFVDHERTGDHVADAAVTLRCVGGDESDDRDAERCPVGDPHRPPSDRATEAGKPTVALAHDTEPDDSLADREPGDSGEHRVVQEPVAESYEKDDADVGVLPEEHIGIGGHAEVVVHVVVDVVADALGPARRAVGVTCRERQEQNEHQDRADDEVDDPRAEAPAHDGGWVVHGRVGRVHPFPQVIGRHSCAASSNCIHWPETGSHWM